MLAGKIRIKGDFELRTMVGMMFLPANPACEYAIRFNEGSRQSIWHVERILCSTSLDTLKALGLIEESLVGPKSLTGSHRDEVHINHFLAASSRGRFGMGLAHFT